MPELNIHKHHFDSDDDVAGHYFTVNKQCFMY
jgi:hypothetical protein